MKKYESGRSMVEIIGVLAVIGVLSVGGIAGYRYGMDKYHANEIINDVNMRMIDVAQQVFRNQSEIAIPEDWDIKGRSGYVIDLFQNTDSEPSIMVEKVPTSVCKMVLQNTPDTQDIYVGVLNGNQVDGNWYLGNNEDICEGSDKEMLFAMSPEILAGFNPDSEDYVEPEGTATTTPKPECYSNADCRPDKPYCNDGTCVACFTDNDCKSRNHYCSEGICEKCPDNTPFWNGTAKKCVECITDDDCVGENTLCFDDNTSCTASHYNTCKTYTIHASSTINGKEWFYVYVDDPAISHEHYWSSWWDAKKVCAHLNKKLPSVSEMINNWNGINNSTCYNSWDCGYTYTDLSQTVFAQLNLTSVGYWFWYEDNYEGDCSALNSPVSTSSSGYIGTFGKHYDNNGRRALCHD